MENDAKEILLYAWDQAPPEVLAERLKLSLDEVMAVAEEFGLTHETRIGKLTH